MSIVGVKASGRRGALSVSPCRSDRRERRPGGPRHTSRRRSCLRGRFVIHSPVGATAGSGGRVAWPANAAVVAQSSSASRPPDGVMIVGGRALVSFPASGRCAPSDTSWRSRTGWRRPSRRRRGIVRRRGLRSLRSLRHGEIDWALSILWSWTFGITGGRRIAGVEAFGRHLTLLGRLRTA